MSEARPQRIVVPTRSVQGGFDIKFETDPYDVKLHGIFSQQQYTDVIQAINQKIKPARSNAIDKALLVTGPLLVPLALWGARHGLQARKRKRLLRHAIEEFNEEYPELLMRWNRGGPESKLTIERRPADAGAVPAGGDWMDGVREAAAQSLGPYNGNLNNPASGQTEAAALPQPLGSHNDYLIANELAVAEAKMVV